MAVIITDSVRIRRMIDTGLAPSALRMPNSEVRSVTVTSMMLLTPTMPASKVPLLAAACGAAAALLLVILFIARKRKKKKAAAKKTA